MPSRLPRMDPHLPHIARSAHLAIQGLKVSNRIATHLRYSALTILTTLYCMGSCALSRSFDKNAALAAVVALVRAAGAALEHLGGELRCTFDDLFCTVSSADKHLTRTDVRAAVAYLRTENEIVVDRDSQHRPGRDIIVFLED